MLMLNRFWISTDNGATWTEVSKERYVEVERMAGFHNTLNQPDEPATSAFSSSNVSGTMFDPQKGLADE